MANGEAPQSKTKKRSPAKVAQILERGTRILELRKSGASLRAISRELIKQAEAKGEPTRGYSYQQVKRDYDEIVALRREEQASKIDEITLLSEERLEDMILNFMPYARIKIDGLTAENLVRMKAKAGDIVIKAVRELTELYGVKRPQKVEMSGLDGKPFQVITAISIEPVASAIPKPSEPEEEAIDNE